MAFLSTPLALPIDGRQSETALAIARGAARLLHAHALCVNIPDEHKVHYVQPNVGHYGSFNGSRFQAEIAPRIADFVLSRNSGRNLRAPLLKVVGQR